MGATSATEEPAETPAQIGSSRSILIAQPPAIVFLLAQFNYNITEKPTDTSFPPLSSRESS